MLRTQQFLDPSGWRYFPASACSPIAFIPMRAANGGHAAFGDDGCRPIAVGQLSLADVGFAEEAGFTSS
jgi:hypothetical protein